MPDNKLPFDFKINGRTIQVSLPRERIKVTDLLALLRYMEMHKEITDVSIAGPGGYLIVEKDY